MVPRSKRPKPKSRNKSQNVGDGEGREIIDRALRPAILSFVTIHTHGRIESNGADSDRGCNNDSNTISSDESWLKYEYRWSY